jgi:hypothetical protein
MIDRFSRAGTVIGLLIVVGLGWMLWEMARQTSGGAVIRPGTPDSVLVFTPGRSILAYNVFIILVALIPTVYFGMALLERGRRTGSPAPRRRVVHGALFGLSLCAAAALAGFSFDLLRSEIRVTHDRIEYRSGAQKTAIEIAEIRRMVLRLKDRNQSLDLTSRTKLVRIDLSPFAVVDRATLVKGLPQIAHLAAIGQWKDGELLWVRIGSQAVPD